ncbi:LysR substrate-binding domain-containing protein [Pseudomonas silvicola]|nr:LysR substrate-binding domain-containing protein [Pseudomonas silvicola]
MARLPPLPALRAFEAAARLESVSEAAATLGLTHAVIVRQLRELEAWFETPLLSRHGRGMRLTAAGSELSTSLTDVFKRLDQACGRTLARPSDRPLILACPAPVASRWLIPRLAEFNAAHPELSMRLMFDAGDTCTLPENADLAIIPCDGPYQGQLQAWPLFSGAAQPVCSPALLQRSAPLDTAQALLATPLLHHIDSRPWQQWFADAGLEDLPPQPGLVFDDFNEMSTAAIAGHGVALCPLALVEQDVRLGLLKVVSPLTAGAARHYVLVHRAEGDRRVVAAREWVVGIAV